MLTLATDGVPARDRAEFWADLVSRHVTPVRIEPSGRHAVRGEIRAQPIGGLTVAEVSGRGVRASHTRLHVARATEHVYAACIHVEGDARLTRRGETILLRPGDVFLTDSRYPFTFDLSQSWRHLVTTIPTHCLDGRVARRDAVAGAVLRGHPVARLWASHVSTAFAVGDQLSATAGTLFARLAIDLLGELLEESHPLDRAPSPTARDVLYTSACRLIALDLGDPALTPDAIARALGVSGRTLARAFAAKGETVMRRVLDERVRQAARLLASPAAAHRSITAIAFACGFNDLSHFGRAFASRLHATPSAWRRQTSVPPPRL